MSQGCVRIHHTDIEKLYDKVQMVALAFQLNKSKN
ncbi:L,D-transpeptidase [Priestia megaterium]